MQASFLYAWTIRTIICTVKRLRILKGFCPSAQGREERATLEQGSQNISNRNTVVSIRTEHFNSRIAQPIKILRHPGGVRVLVLGQTVAIHDVRGDYVPLFEVRTHP